MGTEENFKFWKQIWEEKGDSDCDNLFFLNGWDQLNYKISSLDLILKIIAITGMKNGDMVLDVGCGAGFFGQILKNKCIYVGVDYSKKLVEKHKKYFNNVAFVCEAKKLFFPENTFDIVLCSGVSQYFPNKDYAYKSFQEMERVAKRCIFICDMKSFSENERHLIYKKEEMEKLGFFISNCLYDFKNPYRFNALKMK